MEVEVNFLPRNWTSRIGTELYEDETGLPGTESVDSMEQKMN
jgi:hypothetical protein